MYSPRATTKRNMKAKPTYTYKVIKKGKHKRTIWNVHKRPLGHKNEPYYNTEAEMLSCAIYKYETLSKDEKIIYNKTEK